MTVRNTFGGWGWGHFGVGGIGAGGFWNRKPPNLTGIAKPTTLTPKTYTPYIPEPPMGFVQFRSYVPHYEFLALIGDSAVVPTGGYGGWDVTQRPRRRGLTEWNGNDPMTIDIAVLIDDFIDGTSVEGACQQLELMAGWGGTGDEPPLLAFQSGGLIPHDQHDGPTHDWVISALVWGDADRNLSGNRVRQAATITVMQYVEDDVLSDKSAAQRRKAKKEAAKAKGNRKKIKTLHNKPYHIKKSDTLVSIAINQYHDKSRWKDIAKKNGIRDPKNLKEGRRIVLP